MDLHYYLQNLHQYIQSQDERIRQLETKLLQFEKELNDLKQTKPLHVGTIEYKFDQLKIETLEGTLNIGLNPSELGEMDDFTISSRMPTNEAPNFQSEHLIEIEKEIDQYLDGEFLNVIGRISEEQQITMDEPYIQFIRDDIKKQLPKRIEYYLKQWNAKDEREITSDVIEKIVSQMKKDIESAILQFLQHFPTDKKE